MQLNDLLKLNKMDGRTFLLGSRKINICYLEITF